MTLKEFAQNAIKNGYGSKDKNGSRDLCAGWDWMRGNLTELDWVFQSEDYKKQDGMKYKCMPFLTEAELSDGERDVLGTAWYLNNEREHEKAKTTHEKKMLEDGWILFTEDVLRAAFAEKKKIRLSATAQGAIFSKHIDQIFKPLVDAAGKCWLLPPKATRRGYYISQFQGAFCKIL